MSSAHIETEGFEDISKVIGRVLARIQRMAARHEAARLAARREIREFGLAPKFSNCSGEKRGSDAGECVGTKFREETADAPGFTDSGLQAETVAPANDGTPGAGRVTNEFRELAPPLESEVISKAIGPHRVVAVTDQSCGAQVERRGLDSSERTTDRCRDLAQFGPAIEGLYDGHTLVGAEWIGVTADKVAHRSGHPLTATGDEVPDAHGPTFATPEALAGLAHQQVLDRSAVAAGEASDGIGLDLPLFGEGVLPPSPVRGLSAHLIAHSRTPQPRGMPHRDNREGGTSQAKISTFVTRVCK